MSAQATSVTWALGVVIGGAAIGKLGGKHNLSDVVVCLIELLVAGVALVAPLSAAGLSSLVLTTAYLVHALAIPSGTHCQCFGSRLPSLDRDLQLLRNAILFAASVDVIVSAAVGTARAGGLTIMPLSCIGVTLGAMVVIVPWLIQSEVHRREHVTDLWKDNA